MGRRPGSRVGHAGKQVGVRIRPATFDWLAEVAARANGGKGRPVSTQAALLLERLHDSQIAAGRAAPIPEDLL